ncbi:FMN-binding protein MioC [Arsenophonus symbiont of Ornithomya chloropus]|uniref:FMN-binding protein MioC n=1 Tax=Arsenophonus symbiont of Ornithomya chloropus TaxID=634121 RepID=UPI0032B25D85
MTKITLITGSTMGTAEYIAEYTAEILEKYNFETNIKHGPNLIDLSMQGIWLIVCSTHGAGELPENIESLAKEINKKKPNLNKIFYGAIGIGSKEYDTFCSAIHKLDVLLKKHNAKRIGKILEIDILESNLIENLAKNWIEKWKNNIINVQITKN